MTDRLDEVLDAAAAESAAGKLDDAEIQRLVALSRDASYRRSERVPVKSTEAFEPRSLVSIAMAAQRRREEEMRFAAETAPESHAQEATQPQDAGNGDADGTAAGAQSGQGDETTGPAEAVAAAAAAQTSIDQEAAADNGEASDGDGMAVAGDTVAGEAVAGEAVAGEAVAGDAPSAETAPNIDFEAGHTSGLEEGRKVGFDEGHAKGMEEGRAAGRAEASAQLERAIQAFETATAKLADLAEIDSAALSDSIHGAVLALASERAGYAISDLPDAFATRIEKLLGTIRTVSGEPVIRLNAADLAAIAPLVETRDKLRHCSFVDDEDMARGDLSVTLGTIGIDDMLGKDALGKSSGGGDRNGNGNGDGTAEDGGVTGAQAGDANAAAAMDVDPAGDASEDTTVPVEPQIDSEAKDGQTD